MKADAYCKLQEILLSDFYQKRLQGARGVLAGYGCSLIEWSDGTFTIRGPAISRNCGSVQEVLLMVMGALTHEQDGYGFCTPLKPGQSWFETRMQPLICPVCQGMNPRHEGCQGQWGWCECHKPDDSGVWPLLSSAREQDK